LSESDLSGKLIKTLRKKYGSHIWIQKKRAEVIGEPDISCVLDGVPYFFECKIVNSQSLKNTHRFSEIQIFTLKEREKAGAICLGLLMLDSKNVKCVLPKDIPEDGIVDYNEAQPFNLLES